MWQDHFSAWDTTKRTRAPPDARVASPTRGGSHKTRLMLEQATGQEEPDIPVAPVVTPFKHGKPFVTEEHEMSVGTQMFNLHR